jgi:hypothetical protein
MLWKRYIDFIDDTQISPSSFLVELVIKRGGHVTNANAMGFILLNVHP